MESLAKRMNMTLEKMLTYLLRCYKEDPKVSDFAEAWRIQFEYTFPTKEEYDFIFPTGIRWDPNAIPLIEWVVHMRKMALELTSNVTLNPEEVANNCWEHLSGEELEDLEENIDFERFMSVAEGRYKD